MLMRMKGVPADAMLIQVCDRDYCRERTMHGPLSRLRWAWADDAEVAVRPVVFCRGCGLPCRDVFELEPLPATEEPHQ